jgi:DNA repair exonuclease SbcCD nuclease subunit
MKVLHLSDLHLGHRCYGIKRRQNFLRSNLLSPHEGGIIDTIASTRPDVVVVAGDIFDNSSPLYDDLSSFSGFVMEVNKLKCQVVGVTGNHDKQPGSGMQVSEFFGIDAGQSKKLPIKIVSENHMYRKDLMQFCEVVESGDMLILHQSMHGFLSSIMSPELTEEMTQILSEKFKYVALGDLHVHKQMKINDCVFSYPGTVDFLRVGEDFENFAAWMVEFEGGGLKSVKSVPLVPMQRTMVAHISQVEGYERAKKILKEDSNLLFVCKAIENKELYQDFCSFLEDLEKSNPMFCFKVQSYVKTDQVEKIMGAKEDSDFISIVREASKIEEDDKQLAVDLWTEEETKRMQAVLERDLKKEKENEDQ